jgi:hypothetical protein
MQCPNCKGSGFNPIKTHGSNYYCPFCRMKKDLDWVEYIIGVKAWYNELGVPYYHERLEEKYDH